MNEGLDSSLEDIQTENENIFGQNDIWIQHVPLPRVLDVTVQLLETCDKASKQDLLEDVLPSLCFALPHNAKGCSQILHSLPRNSSVWHKLEEGLSNKKYLPVEVTATLYEQHVSALENEMIRVLSQYANVVYKDDWRNKKEISIAHFKAHGEPVNSDQSTGIKRKRDESPTESELECIKSNLWAHSPLVLAAVYSRSVFSLCVQFLIKVVVQSNFSISCILGSRDYFAQIFSEVDRELYELFPTHMQHLVYLLTLPITVTQGPKYLNNPTQLSVIENALLKAMRAGSDEVRALLCFFPYWLPVLDQSQFFNNYLRQEVCEFQFKF
ncbi:uncharacterized protein LOC121861001 [Homarus americanus]|uniref:Uncharacterized protein n=1 Tax=Homarus americanus TaxID=6706 RepID=A0A8J5N4C2_HOMAM|nr:uncharacterized protein LOC121861001 [Homarus americanus]KAG7173106.1 hypothetical protein Hamer_G008632 [Homarus americanus]